MKDVIKAIHDGDIYPDEDIMPQDEGLRELERKINDEKEYFKKGLSEEDLIRFDELEGFISEENTIYTYEHFKYGFKLGIHLMSEVFLDKDAINQLLS